MTGRVALPLALSASLLAACGDDDREPRPVEVETPPQRTYDDASMPRADLPLDETTWNELEMPLPQVGTDTGDDGIIYSAALAGYYLLRVQKPSGRFGYSYDPRTGEFDDNDLIHRQVVAALALARLMRVTGRPEFRLATAAALSSFLTATEPSGDGIYLHDLGATALLAMTLTAYARHTGSDDHDSAIDAVGAFLLPFVEDDGSVTAGGTLQWAQLHLAFWRLHAHTGDVAYLDAVERLGRYHHERMGQFSVFEFPYLYGLWAHEPLTGLYDLRGGEWIPELIFWVADHTTERQYLADWIAPAHWVGGYHPNSGNRGPNWNSTIKLEAVIDAYPMAVRVGDTRRAERYRTSAILGAQFLVRWQVHASAALGVPEVKYAIGGIPLFMDDPRIRIDIPGHGLVALTKVAERLDLEDFPGEGH